MSAPHIILSFWPS